MPIPMFDNELSVNVDVYQFGIPDCFGCNTLVYYKGDSPLASQLPENDPMVKQLQKLFILKKYLYVV